MNQAFLLWAANGIVSCVEVGYQNPLEIGKKFLGDLTFPAFRKKVKYFMKTGQYPNESSFPFDVRPSFVCMNNITVNNSFKDLLFGFFVIIGNPYLQVVQSATVQLKTEQSVKVLYDCALGNAQVNNLIEKIRYSNSIHTCIFVEIYLGCQMISHTFCKYRFEIHILQT